MKRIGVFLLWLLGIYLVARAVIEPFVIDLNDPASYQNDWGGPSLAGVLLVHCGLGVVAAGLMAWRLTRRSNRRLRRSTADRAAPPKESDRPAAELMSVGSPLTRQQERGREGQQQHQESHA